jgi:phage shock protein PspC (stress-responsive transcriptional regulator)
MEPMTDTTVRPSLDKEPAPAPLSDPAPADGAFDPTGDSVPARGTGFRLHRSRTDRMIGGVLGGLAESLGVDAALLRVGLIALTLLGAGIGVVLYVAAWILVPEGDAA